MGIQSLGVGSGLALDDLVNQLLEAERKPKADRLDAREERIEAEVSGVGKLKSRLDDFLDVVKELGSSTNLQSREPTISNPDENVEPFTAEAANSAVEGNYQVAVTQLASGSRLETAAGAFATSSSVVAASAGTLSFDVGASGKSFSLDVTAGQTLQQIRDAINASDDNFGVNASIINTGTAEGAKLVLTSSVTGAGNDLVVSSTGDAGLAAISSGLDPRLSAQNAKATIDGIEVESSTNKFENTIENVSLDVSELSPLAADGITFETSRLTIGLDKESLRENIDDFVEKYNGLITEINVLTRFGESELEDDGALAGDSQVRGLLNGLSSIIGGANTASALGGLFQIGVELDQDGKLEISSTDDFGLGSGIDRLNEALDDNFDDIAALFTDDNQGVATRLEAYISEYTKSGGLLSTRENTLRDDRDQLDTEREQFELRILSFEQVLRDRYLNLDQTVARLNQTGNALLASLGR